MDRFAGTFAAAGLVLSVVVHVFAIGHVDLSEYVPGVWLLHAAVFPPFFFFILAVRRDYPGLGSLSPVLAAMPRWVTMAAAALFAYAMVNFAYSMALQPGQADIVDGKYALTQKGKFIQEISEADYHGYRAYTMRGFSGHWMIFFAVPAAYFLTRRQSV